MTLHILMTLSLKIGNTPSNLRIVDYSHGLTGSAHDARAFEYTTAALHPNWFFEGNEFAWTDSAYTVNSRTIPIHKEPASRDCANAIFDKMVSHLQVRSEHCMGMLKGRWQCLCGLRVSIDSKEEHVAACRWITIAIILHNFIIGIEGSDAAHEFAGAPGLNNAIDIDGADELQFDGDGNDDDAKRRQLVAELMAYQALQD